ncbi:hypothetical protein BH09BAC1_BH09BAC1_00420 [soil metagenome]
MCPQNPNNEETLDQNSKEILGQTGDQNGGNEFPPEKAHQKPKGHKNGNSGQKPLKIGHGGQPGTRNK